MKRGFDILPEQAQEWEDNEIEGYLNALEQQGRQQGRQRAMQLLAEQGRGPWAPQQSASEPVEEKPKRRTKAATEKEAE